MYRKSVGSGLLVGILTSLVLSVSIINDQAQRYVPQWGGAEISWLPREVLFTFSAIVAAILFLFFGLLAALRLRPRNLRQGFKVGAISGLVAGLVLYLFLLAPLAVIRSGGPLYYRMLSQEMTEAQQQAALAEAVLQTMRLSLSAAFLAPLVGLLMGGVEGLIYVFIRRAGGRLTPEEPTPSLLELIRQGRPARWGDQQDHTVRAGLLGGAIVGGFLSLEALLLFTLVIPELPAEVQQFLNQRIAIPFEHATRIQGVAAALLFLVPVAALLWGGLGVLLLKHPPTRFRSRFSVSTIAGATAGTLFSAIVLLPAANVGLSLMPIGLVSEGVIEPTLANLHDFVRGLFTFYPVLPLFLILVLTLLGFLSGLPFVIFTAFAWPRRPVDRAASLVNQIRRQPDAVLPQIYTLFQRDRQAVEVLLHTAIQLHRGKQQPLSQLTAAYHTIYEQQEERAEAIKAVAAVLAEQPSWRWRTEIGELYRFFEEGLQVRTIRHLAAIRPLPEERTSSLPTELNRAGDLLSHVVTAVKKAQQLDDPNSRTIYLNRALETVTMGERFIVEEMAARTDPHCSKNENCATPYPEREILASLLPRWRETLHDSLRDLRGRALLQVELQTHQATYMPTLPLRLRVSNQGLNVAERVRIGIDPGEDYRLTEQSEARIELLPPGEEQIVELALEPRNPRRMRVLLRAFFNDAVDDNRELTWADEVVFIEEDRPFQRIFPIPYVTGTPLKSDEMFFGRQDVFDYVREHLLGAYQNNIIVLHGQRRTGKTSVLYRLSEVLQDTHFGVLVDMQGIPARSASELFYSISDEIAYVLEGAGVEVEIPPLEEYEARPELTFRASFLRPIYSALGEKHLLLMFDEFEEMQYRVEAGHIGAELFPFLRNLMQHERSLDFVFSGTHKLEDLAAEYWSILFNIATYKKISFLGRADAERLIVDPVAPYGMEYDPTAVAHVYQVTAGHPFLTQLVCHELVAYHNETERSYMTVSDVDAVLGRIVERGEAHFKYIWSESEPADRVALLTLAELLAHAGGATAEDVAALSERRGRAIDADQALRALVRLEARDIVTRAALGSERFRFRVDLVRRWIAQNPQLADTISEV